MTRDMLPGLVLWPAEDGLEKAVAVLLSDVHCTDCSVGNQTVAEADWENFFRELNALLADKVQSGHADRVLVILNGDIVDVVRSGRWTENQVYPWQRQHPAFQPTLLQIMEGIRQRHGAPRAAQQSSGFFYELRQMRRQLQALGARVSLIPILGNHDKELQVCSEARRIYYEGCLGLSEADLDPPYRQWVAEQLGCGTDEAWPLLPLYFAAPTLKLLATHGQWRDDTNRGRRGFACGAVWEPQRWRQDACAGFAAPCFGDTIAAGLLSRFICRTQQDFEDHLSLHPENNTAEGEPGPVSHLLNILQEMDLYRPSALGVARLLQESAKLESKGQVLRVRQRVIANFSEALNFWLGCGATRETAPSRFLWFFPVLKWLSRLNVYCLNVWLMRGLAWLSDQGADGKLSRIQALPAFSPRYRALGFRLQVEGHTHAALEQDLYFATPDNDRNYVYVNLGAWRDRIVEKARKGFRRRSTGRALVVCGAGVKGGYSYTLRDVTTWAARLDRW